MLTYASGAECQATGPESARLTPTSHYPGLNLEPELPPQSVTQTSTPDTPLGKSPSRNDPFPSTPVSQPQAHQWGKTSLLQVPSVTNKEANLHQKFSDVLKVRCDYKLCNITDLKSYNVTVKRKVKTARPILV